MARVEIYTSRTVTFTEQGIQGQRKFKCEWSERFAVKPAIGEPFPDLIGLYCTQVKVEGTGQAVAGANYTHAFITADYSSRDTSKQQATGAIIEESLEFDGEMLTREGGRWKDCLQDASKETIGGQYFPRIVYTVKKSYASITQIARDLRDATSTVNKSTFLGVEPGHWLMQGGSAETFVDELGKRKWAVTMRFVYNHIGWQKDWHGRCTKDGVNQEKGRWEEVLYIPENGTDFTENKYRDYDFNKLVPERRRG